MKNGKTGFVKDQGRNSFQALVKILINFQFTHTTHQLNSILNVSFNNIKLHTKKAKVFTIIMSYR